MRMSSVRVRPPASFSLVAAGCLDELRRGHLRVRVLDDPGDLVAVEAAVEADADPAAVPDVGGDVEALRVRLDEHCLHPVRCGADEREPAVAVVAVPDGREGTLVSHEERRCAVRGALARLGEPETDLTDGFEDLHLGHERDLAPRLTVWSSAASTRGSSSAIRALRT